MDETKVTNEVHKDLEKPSSNIQSEKLGKPLAIFKFDPLGDYGELFSLLLVLGFTMSLILFWWTIRDEGLRGLFSCTTIPFLFLFLLGVSRILNWVRHREDQVTLYENGFVYLKASQPLELRWDEITEVEHKTFPINSRRGSYIKTSHSYYIRGENTPFVALNTNIENVKTLGTTIQERVTERLLPTANQKIAAGEKISFGPFTVGVDSTFKCNFVG